MISRQLMPFVAGDDVTLGSSQYYAMLDPKKLRNNSRNPCLVDEIRFSCPAFVVNPFMYISARIKFAVTSLTNDYVPVSLMGNVFNRWPQALLIDTLNGNNQYSYQQVWRFPKPIYLGSTEEIFIELQLNRDLFDTLPDIFGGQLANYDIPLNVNLVCRSLPIDSPLPEVNQIPLITSYTSDPFVYEASTIQRSTQANLLNPYGDDFKVYQLIGRLFTQFDDAYVNSFGFTQLDYTEGPGSDYNPRLWNKDVTLKINHSTGAQVIKDYTPWSHVFSTVDNAWWLSSVLRPKGYYIVTLQADMRDYVEDDLPEQFASPNFAQIGLIGYRQVRLR